MAHLSHTSPMYIPSAGSKRNSSPIGARLSSSPLPGSSFFDAKPSSVSSASVLRTTPPMGSSLRPPTLQRSKSINAGPSRPQTPAHHPTTPPAHHHPPTDTMPARPRTPNMPHRLNTMPIGTAPERPPVPTRSSTLPHARSHSAGGGNGNSGTYPFVLDDEESDANRRRVRAEMMQWVKSEVESIEKETSETAKRNLENIRKNIRRRGSITVEPPTPIRIAEENSNPFHYVRKPQSRRGSVDSAVAGGWKPVEIPRKAKDWERWAENKVQARRRLDEVWRNEENVVDEAERLIKETQTQEKIRRERDARKQWERQAFLEKVIVFIILVLTAMC
ncbi:hypothetical protein M408DRAFT_91769 [Serendipita vermifera MAFF 305830]|uniref:Uncharacterized protein n=1 Tax=Serendipita vermifera MAFF 305830 TaxID=933852 RepID=A0A0C3BQ31_SERVB|nr:hypothetical protein M408DRAFT_91769 [Serendipita vermifera MAFF 305830]